MNHGTQDSGFVKYDFYKPIYVDSSKEEEFVYDVWAYECNRQKKALPEPYIIIRGDGRDPVQDYHSHKDKPTQERFSEMLFPCGEIWEHYEYFSDPQGRFPFFFYRNTDTQEPDKEDSWGDEYPFFIQDTFEFIAEAKTKEQIEFDRLFGHLPTLDNPGHEMSEEERKLERFRYISKVKKVIRRIVNRNQLYYMYTLTFALRENEKVQGLRFTDMMDSDTQRNRELVLKVWNKRLVVIRRVLQAERGTFRFLLVLEKHDSERTCAEKRGTYHLHLATDMPIDKHILQRLWGYGVCWVDDFTKEKRWLESEGKYVNVEGDFIRNPGEYMAKYLDKEIENPEFLCKHGYSCSRGNLVRPEEDVRRQHEDVQEIKENPMNELDRQGIQLDPVQRERIQVLTDIETVKVFDSLEENGGLKKVEITIMRGNDDTYDELDMCPDPEKKLTFYMRFRKYNFRKLHPKYKDPPQKDEKKAPENSFIQKK